MTILGYSNSPYVNGTSSNYSGGLSSNEIPGLPGLGGAKSNIDAAAGIVPDICTLNGGAKKLKRKIKNITKQYKKMKVGGKRMTKVKKLIRSRLTSRSRMLTKRRTLANKKGKRTRRPRRHKRSRKQRGGYSQFQNNQPITPTYQVAGVSLPPSELAMASPPPISSGGNTSCIDNYDHRAGSGFSSIGN